MRVLLLTALLVVASAAQAYGPDPRLYFLKDDENGPVGDGILSVEFPPPVDTEPGVENKSAPGVRNIVPYLEQISPVQFVGGSGNSTGHLFGPVIVALWAPSTPAMQNGTLKVDLIKVTEPSVLNPLPAQGEVLASSEVLLYWDNESMPAPESLIPTPPSPPNGTDPEGIIAQAQAAAQAMAGEVLADVVPLALYPPFVLILDDDVPDYYIDERLEKDQNLALRMSVIPPPGATTVDGVAQPLEYDFLLAPSFVYVPWFNDTLPENSDPGSQPSNPNNPNNPSNPNNEGSSNSGNDNPGGSETTDGGKDSPGVGFAAILALLGAALYLHRRK